MGQICMASFMFTGWDLDDAAHTHWPGDANDLHDLDYVAGRRYMHVICIIYNFVVRAYPGAICTISIYCSKSHNGNCKKYMDLSTCTIDDLPYHTSSIASFLIQFFCLAGCTPHLRLRNRFHTPSAICQRPPTLNGSLCEYICMSTSTAQLLL